MSKPGANGKGKPSDQVEMLKESKDQLTQQLKYLQTAMDPEKAAGEVVASLANSTDPLAQNAENEWTGTSKAGGGEGGGSCAIM